MADGSNRIEQFRKMATDDPNNPLGHFSLGREYLNAGMNAEAAASLRRTIEVDPNISKAYQLLATALLKQGQRDEAVGRLTEGVKRADERGDVMPRNEMTKMLQELGAPVPETKASAAAQAPVGEGEVRCVRCQRVARKLPKPPFRNAMGQEIFEKVCADCWREWIGMGTKVINELRLPLNDPQAQKIYDQHMVEFLNLR
jgi:Fe-S cluster biosynthesis and repair protein YggX